MSLSLIFALRRVVVLGWGGKTDGIYTVMSVVVVVVVACPAPRQHNHAYVFHYSATSVSCRRRRRRATRTSLYVACINYNVALHACAARAKEIGFPTSTVKRNYAPATFV